MHDNEAVLRRTLTQWLHHMRTTKKLKLFEVSSMKHVAMVMFVAMVNIAT